MALKKHLPILLLSGIISSCLFSTDLRADNWQARIYEYGAPGHIVGVDKKKGVFNFFEKKSPLRLRYSFPCVTGQLPGDKQQLNDLRTPEGIYFVEYKIANGLDFKEYGGIAYTLNYPNPVDRLRGKTGHGIWIHSKGFELVPTRGCVAIGRKDIKEVGPLLVPGTPVVVAEELAGTAERDNGTLGTLKNMMSEWSKAWADRSPRLFDYYDPDSYSRATENFEAFRLNKERLFKMLTSIKIYNREIHALEGPGYWVTWSEQFYTASNLSTEGIRRLYWQKDKDGQFRIVGMEWTPRDLGLAAAAKEGRLIAEIPSVTATDASQELPAAPRLDMPESAPPSVPNTMTALIPARDQVSTSRPTPALMLPSSPPLDRITLTDSLRHKILNLSQDWENAIVTRDAGIESFYDSKNYNKLPKGTPRGKSLASVLAEHKKDFRQPWIKIISRNPEININGQLVNLAKEVLFITPKGMRQGIQTLSWHKDDKGDFRIVGSNFKPAALGLEASYLEQVSGSIAERLEEWRKAWEGGDLDRYMEFYAPNAMQQGRIGANNIRKQKESLWARVKPAEVRLSGLRVALEGNGARADMTQAFTNSAGHADKGIKTVHLRFDGSNWLIQREDWVNANPTTGI